MWTPTHVVVTVLKARNLLEKGKGGNDAYCLIGMGKEKFLTSVKTKTLSPLWDEQAEFALGEREDLKLTVYHKSSIIDEFIGRAVINVADLASQDNNHSHVGWFKLQGKPDKSGNNKKPEKERGEIEARIDFIIKPKTGSMMDLSIKNKEKSLSLKNLKYGITDKFKILNKSRKSSKFAGENQLAEQSRRMGGSKLDFLDGDDVGSIASSYSSINGPSLSRLAPHDSKMNSMSRFNPARSSFISRTSSKMDNDSASVFENETRNDEDFLDENDSNEFDQDSANNSSFQRQNSSRFVGSSLSRQLSKRSSLNSSRMQANKGDSNNETKNDNESKEPVSGSVHIAPLPPFNPTSTPTLTPRSNGNNETNQQKHRYQVINSTIDEENSTVPSKNEKKKEKSNNDNKFKTEELVIENLDFTSYSSNSPISTGLKSPNNNSTPPSNNLNAIFETDEPKNKPTKENKNKGKHNPFSSDDDQEEDKSFKLIDNKQKSQKQEKSSTLKSNVVNNAKSFNNFSIGNDEDEDHIDWASSEDEEILQQEVKSFERNQLMRQSERRRLMPAEDLTSDLNSEADFKSNHNNTLSSSVRQRHVNGNEELKPNRSSMHIDLKQVSNGGSKSKINDSSLEDDIKTPDFDADYAFQDQLNDSNKTKLSNETNARGNNSGLPDLINSKESDKARKYLEGLDGVKFNEIQVPDNLKKQLEYFDRDELLQLIAYQKKYLDFKESRIKDLENYIDNLVVKIIETEPLILMNASNVLTKSRNLI